MKLNNRRLRRYVRAIESSGLTIYDKITIGHSELWIPTQDMEELLHDNLVGISLSGLPLRTRSKVAKERICQALGYPIPTIFKKTKPRFPGQNFDTYVQKSNNLKVWNEDLSPTRRYVLIRVDQDDTITGVRIVTGRALMDLDTTGTLTKKYQVRLVIRDEKAELVSGSDTDVLRDSVRPNLRVGRDTSPVEFPAPGQLIPIDELFVRLRPLIGTSFANIGYDQERNRGAVIHKLVCQYLGYDSFHDDGVFPDVRNQLLEVKLQTSPTIDLGIVRPDSAELLDVPRLGDRKIRHCDVRYAIFYGESEGVSVVITSLFVTTGIDFFGRFPQFKGAVLNSKLQIPLPDGFFG